MLCVTIVIWVFASAVCSAAPTLDVASNERDPNDVNTEISDVTGLLLSVKELISNRETGQETSYTADHDYMSTKRKKRAVSLFAKALTSLLKGAKLISKSQSRRNYEKPGDSVTAMEDFLSFKPVSFRERTTGSGAQVTTSRIGDKIIRLSISQNASPSLEIMDKAGHYSNAANSYVNRIFYRKDIHQ